MGRKSILKPALKQMEKGEHLTIEDRLIKEYQNGVGFGKLCNLIESETGTKISPPTLREYLTKFGLEPDTSRKRRKQSVEEKLVEFKRNAPIGYTQRLTRNNKECPVNECPTCMCCEHLMCHNYECKDRPDTRK